MTSPTPASTRRFDAPASAVAFLVPPPVISYPAPLTSAGDLGPAAAAPPPTPRARALVAARWIGPGLALAVFLLAISALRGELAAHSYQDVVRELRAIPLRRLLAAGALTALAYAILPAYDALALAYAGRRLPARRVGLGGFIAYGLSQTLGFPALTGSAVRYRLWSAWGLSTVEIAHAASFAGLTFTLGVLFVSGVALLAEPVATLRLLMLPAAPAHALGAALLAVVAAFVGWSVVRGGRTLRLASWVLPVPTARLAFGQLLVAAADWAAAAGVLYVLLPEPLRGSGLAFLPFAGAFVLAQTAGLLSHVPGGLGVFDTLMVLLLGPYLPADQALGVLLAYRVIYYFVPFALALLALAGHEAAQRRGRLAQAAGSATTALRGAVASTSGAAAQWIPVVLPTALSAATFAAGVVLLVSGATPGVRARETELVHLVPLPVMEVSHLMGSLAGAALLVLAWAIRRRLDAAYGLTIATLALGIVASLLKGIDYEEAIVLALVLAAVVPFRAAFYRRAALTSEPFTPGWTLAVVAVLGTVAWVGMLSYKHVEYASDLWWRFRPHADASRFLRAGILTSGGLLAFGLLRLLRHARAEPDPPDAVALARAEDVVRAAPGTTASLALLGDKALLFSPSGQGFIQYGVAGRSWVAMGDPVATAAAGTDERAELAWAFRHLADAHGGWPVFYQVAPEHLPLYIDLGLTMLKLGEEGRVDLGAFSMEGGGRKSLRRVLKDVEKAGATFEVVPPEGVPALLPELRAVSDQWLAHKRVREKGFSLGYFDEAYLARFPVAVLRVPAPADAPASDAPASDVPASDVPAEGRVVAFANLWPGGDGRELSVDLMRFADDAPSGAMDYLFLRLFQWGREQGYAWFNLGMAPLAGVEARQLAPLWARAGALLYRHGEHFYNFRGLRRYKEKFDPVWEPRYLAAPSGLVLPRVLANVTALVSGGVGGLVRR